MIGEGVDPLADHGDVGVLLDRLRDRCGESLSVDRERGAGGYPMFIGRTA